MKKQKNLTPNYLFEVSWEVCNKVGGIHTVVATKAATLASKITGKHIMIGPDLNGANNPEFSEQPYLLEGWKKKAAQEGINLRIGRWNIVDSPIAVLVDFSNFFIQKDNIFKQLWDNYQLDSLTGNWDYIEPAIFGYATGKAIECYVKHYCSPSDNIVAQFHEWMTGSGLLYLKSTTPQVATAFTTHATALGRSIAGNHLPLYDELQSYNPDEMAARFNIVAKQSLEKISATQADVYTTVSDITARECAQFHNKPVDIVTPNGFQDFIKDEQEFEVTKQKGRKALIDVAEAILGTTISKDALLVGTSGRYEFKNKGIDVYLDALAKLNHDENLKKEIVAFILVPAGHHGPVHQLLDNLLDKSKAQPLANPYLSHYLTDEYNDPAINKIRQVGLNNTKEDKVKIFFVPSYLNGDDGVFDMPYYDLLAGLDLSVFPSYYEPWGYTPLESVAYKVPTITTTLAGFGLWVETKFKGDKPGILVIERNDHNDQEVIDSIAKDIKRHAGLTNNERNVAKDNAYQVSKIALWENLIPLYLDAYSLALNKAKERDFVMPEETNYKPTLSMDNKPTPNWHNILVHRNVPKKLKALEDLSRNLWWSWNQDAIDLFASVDEEAWIRSEQNPIAMLDMVSVPRFKELSKDQAFIDKLNAVYDHFKEYMSYKNVMKGPKVAYFCMEYGLHTSLKIYSGGLGVLAGDYIKEASDKRTPITGVGFLYRYGYFTQRLSTSGEQENVYEYQLFDKLPVSPQKDQDGNWLTVDIMLPGRKVYARVWRVDVGRAELLLLDTDFEDNLPEDRSITHHLYGGNWENRLKQEVLLGIGGIRALEKLGYIADVYHLNEGHAALIGFERISILMDKYNLNFYEASEIVRSTSLFTTHTPVPAGHDAFEEGLFYKYLNIYADRFKIGWDQIIALGRVNAQDSNEKFSMSNLAVRLSQEVNGVSWLHGKVSQEMFSNLFPGYLPEEVPVGYVTNGVHYPTWAAPEWKELMEKINGGDMSSKAYDKKCFKNIHEVDDERIWGIRNKLRGRLVEHIKERVKERGGMTYYSPKEIVEISEKLDPNKLTIGFARRFATYKRAELLFRNLDTLNRIINHPEHPVQFVFAGKAHPADLAGQNLIKRIVEISKYPQFIGKVIFIENYDMTLASKMVQGVDIWLNTPTRPMEASGTSGEKAVMNGVMHFSVLDGWWVEGYKKGAGWALPLEQEYENNDFQNELDAETVYNTIETEIAPLFYNQVNGKAPAGWLQYVKNTIDEVASNFTMNRQLVDYEERYYNKLAKRHKEIKKNDYAMAKELVAWKQRVAQEWHQVEALSVETFNTSTESIAIAKDYKLEVTIACGGLTPEDIGVELLMLKKNKETSTDSEILTKIEFKCISSEGSSATYQLNYTPEIPGTYSTGVRVYAKSDLLAYQAETSFVRWL